MRRWSRSRWTPETVRRAVDDEGNQVHLLAAATHSDSLVLAQVEVGAKTGEIPMFAPLLDQLTDLGVDLSEMVITTDALPMSTKASTVTTVPAGSSSATRAAS